MNNKSHEEASILSKLRSLQESVSHLQPGGYVDPAVFSNYQDCVETLSKTDKSIEGFTLNFVNRGDDKKLVTKDEYRSKLNGLITYLDSHHAEEKPPVGFRKD